MRARAVGYHRAMKDQVLRWACFLLAAFAVGPMAGALVGVVRSPEGGFGAQALLAESPIVGLLAYLGVIVLATLMGVLAARFTTVRLGLFCAGLVMAWAAFGTERLDAVIRRAQSGAPLRMLAIEAVMLGVLALAGAVVILRAARPGERHTGGGWKDAVVALVITVPVAALVAAFLARHGAVGQTIASATAGAVAGALVGRIVAPGSSLVAFVAAMVLLATVAPIAAMMADGAAIVQRLYAGHEFALARPMPLDWIAGAFMGVPVGSWWAASMVERQHATADAKPA